MRQRVLQLVALLVLAGSALAQDDQAGQAPRPRVAQPGEDAATAQGEPPLPPGFAIQQPAPVLLGERATLSVRGPALQKLEVDAGEHAADVSTLR